jgi:hypothetical protein
MLNKPRLSVVAPTHKQTRNLKGITTEQNAFNLPLIISPKKEVDTLYPPSLRDPSGRSTADKNDEHNSAKIAIDARSVFASAQEDVGV